MTHRLFLLLGIQFIFQFSVLGQSDPEMSRVILFKSQGLYQEALDELSKISVSKQNCQQELDYQLLRVDLLTKVGALDQVEQLLSTIRPCAEGPSIRIQMAIGNYLLSDGSYTNALDTLQAALDMSDQQSVGIEIEASCMSAIASAHLALGNYSAAEKMERAALHKVEQGGDKRSASYAASLNNLGLILLSKDPARAYENYENALRIFKDLYYFEHPKMAVAYTNLGICHLALNAYDSALQNFELARSIWSQVYPDGHPNIALVLRNMAKVYEKKNVDDLALKYYRESIDTYTGSLGEKHPDLASTFNELASLHLKDSRFEVALGVLDRALMANAIGQNTGDSLFYNSLVALYTLSLRAQTLEAQYLEETLRISDLKLALAAVDQSHALIQKIRRNALAEVDKLRINSLAHDIYETGIRVVVIVGDNTIQGKPYYEKALYFAEQSKNTILQGLIAENKAKKYAGIPDHLLTEEAKYKSVITSIKQRLAQKPDPELEKSLQARLYEVESQLEDLIHRLEREFPTYFDLKYNQEVPSVIALRAKLGSSAALLSYFVAEKSQEIYLFILTAKSFKVRIVPLPVDFDKTLTAFSNSLTYKIPKAFNEASRELGKLLIPPLPAAIKELVIVPQDWLSTIPFEALLIKNNKSDDYNKNRYLIDDYSISYAFSYHFLNGADRNVGGNSDILLFAPVTFKGDAGWEPLPGTQRECETISGLFGSQATTLLRNEASESRLKEMKISDYDLLHFATHGEVDEDHPELSRIVLSNSKGEDGSLYANEIYNLSLDSDLVVLSACQTGLGKISKGEGLLGLSRALMYSGVRNMVVSYWSVSDESTADLMSNFYGGVRSGRGLSQSLQQSKIKIKSNPDYAAPYYWAPFVLNGR